MGQMLPFVCSEIPKRKKKKKLTAKSDLILSRSCPPFSLHLYTGQTSPLYPVTTTATPAAEDWKITLLK